MLATVSGIILTNVCFWHCLSSSYSETKTVQSGPPNCQFYRHTDQRPLQIDSCFPSTARILFPALPTLITPRAHARARGYVIGRGVYISAKLFFYLSKYSLSDAHFNTGRLLFEFNRLLYTLAAPEVFVSSANPVSLPSGYRVSIVRNTNIDQIETTPLRYCMLHARPARYG